MGWQDILKNDSWKDWEDGHRDRQQETLILFREFTPIREITKEEEEEFLSYGSTVKMKQLTERTLEFMKPFDEIKREGLNFVFNFDIEGVPFEFKMPFFGQGTGKTRGIGGLAGDTYPQMKSTGMKFCVKATDVMTNGDFMVTLLLASKNNQLPTILTLPAYVEKHMPEIKLHEEGKHYLTIYDSNEHSYKTTLLEQIWEHVEQIDETEWPKPKWWHKNHINFVDEELKEYIPEELLGRW